MSSNSRAVRLAVIDTDSGFLRVLAKRLESAGWEYRILSGSVPPEELVAMKLNALLVDTTVLRPLDQGDRRWALDTARGREDRERDSSRVGDRVDTGDAGRVLGRELREAEVGSGLRLGLADDDLRARRRRLVLLKAIDQQVAAVAQPPERQQPKQRRDQSPPCVCREHGGNANA